MTHQQCHQISFQAIESLADSIRGSFASSWCVSIVLVSQLLLRAMWRRQWQQSTCKDRHRSNWTPWQPNTSVVICLSAAEKFALKEDTYPFRFIGSMKSMNARVEPGQILRPELGITCLAESGRRRRLILVQGSTEVAFLVQILCLVSLVGVLVPGVRSRWTVDGMLMYCLFG